MDQEILLSGDELKMAITSLPNQSAFGQLIKASGSAVKILISKIAEEEARQAESHDNFNDLFFAQDGEEEFWLGGEIKDKIEIEPGEWLGKNLIGAKMIVLKAGDILIVPKGMAHRHGKGSAVFLIIRIS